MSFILIDDRLQNICISMSLKRISIMDIFQLKVVYEHLYWKYFNFNVIYVYS